jgi:hypothetical protein
VSPVFRLHTSFRRDSPFTFLRTAILLVAIGAFVVCLSRGATQQAVQTVPATKDPSVQAAFWVKLIHADAIGPDVARHPVGFVNVGGAMGRRYEPSDVAVEKVTVGDPDGQIEAEDVDVLVAELEKHLIGSVRWTMGSSLNTDAVLARLTTLSNLTELIIDCSDRWPPADSCTSGLKSIRRIAALERLELIEYPYAGCPTPITDLDLDELVTACPNLEVLRLGSKLAVSPNALRGLRRLTNLRELSFRRSWSNESILTDAHVEALCDLDQLTALDLGVNTALSERSIASICRMHRLESLGLSDCPALDNAALERIGKALMLKKLNVSRSRAGVFAGGKLQGLESWSCLGDLDLTLCTRLDDADMARICSLPTLRALYLHGCDGLTRRGFECIAKTTSMKTVELSQWQAEQGIKPLSASTSIEVLILHNFCTPKVSTARDLLEPLASMKSLKVLALIRLDNDWRLEKVRRFVPCRVYLCGEPLRL